LFPPLFPLKLREAVKKYKESKPGRGDIGPEREAKAPGRELPKMESGYLLKFYS
jgi:hypothetical protein